MVYGFVKRRVFDEPVIAFYCGFGRIPGERPWDGDSISQGIGGSEQCVIRLARALARDHHVIVYNGCRIKRSVDGVTYAPTTDFDPWATYAHLVVWRLPQFLLAQTVATWLRPRRKTTFVAETLTYWVHDGSNLEMLRRGGLPFRRAIAFCLKLTTAVVFPSPEALRDQSAALFPEEKLHDEKSLLFALTICHGLPLYFDALRDSDSVRRHAWVVWPVSVERGLEAVLRHLDDLERAAGSRDFRLFVCHHQRGYHGADGILLADPRVIICGMLPPQKLALIYRRCSLFVFPSCVPEAFSLAAWECMTHGVLPVAYGLGALESLADCGAIIAEPNDETNLFHHAKHLLRHRE